MVEVLRCFILSVPICARDIVAIFRIPTCKNMERHRSNVSKMESRRFVGYGSMRSEIGIDPEKVIVGGGSAGGHIAAVNLNKFRGCERR